MPKLNQRIALVTGAGRGIGRAIAVALAAEGAAVACAARSGDELQDVVSEIESAGGRAVPVTADLAERTTARTLAAEVQRQLGPIDILVNNAGVGSSARPMPVVEFDESFWDLTMEVNVTAPLLLTKSVLPEMLSRGWGRIITVASINSRLASIHGAAYSASKHAVLGLMRTTAMETAGSGVTVNCICPGPVKTRMNDPRVEYDAKRLGRDLAAHEASLTPIGGRLDPADIAPMAVYLAGDEARMITGQAYNIDGGISLV